LIHEGKAASYEALCWQTPKGELACVADGGLNHPWAEVAVLNLTTNRQIESLTFAWMGDLATKVRYVKECETGDFEMGGKANCPIDGEGLDKEAGFTCGCCGTWFQSTITKQRKFDQDEGYGICPDCERYYR
jgi:hypothetical protein